MMNITKQMENHLCHRLSVHLPHSTRNRFGYSPEKRLFIL